MALTKTLRWFGPSDPISLDELAQTGIEGIVTALHHIPNGAVWPEQDIEERHKQIQQKGLDWKVVESVPVHESIKLGEADRDQYMDNYIKTLENLGKYGITTVAYNFMTVVDWVRTNLSFTLPDGRKTMYFNALDLRVFDLYILQRTHAEKDYTAEQMEEARKKYQNMSEEQKNALIQIIAVESQNFIDGTLAKNGKDPIEAFREYLQKYQGLTKEKLRDNLKYFLEKIIPVAEKNNIRMAIHPDDPPFSVFGLPRIVSSLEDFKWITGAVDSPSNGITFCTGSLSASSANDVTQMTRELIHRIQFVHLRNTQRNNQGDFWESEHLNGVINMPEVLHMILKEQQERINHHRADADIPFRPDHGQSLLDDLHRKSHPGYPLIGRLKALAEITGLEKGIEYMMTNGTAGWGSGNCR